MAHAPTPFRLSVPDAEIAALRDRLSRTRWPDQAPSDPWAVGTDVAGGSALPGWAAVSNWRIWCSVVV